MAVIGKIREKSTLLLIVVGGALMAFILTDLFSSRSSVFGGDLQNIGSINGKDIRATEFNDRYQQILERYKVENRGQDIPEFVHGQIRDEVWKQYLEENILDTELDELGVVISTEELADITYGDNPHPFVRNAFTNKETGQFDKNNVIAFLKNIERDETGDSKRQWLALEAEMKKLSRHDKYYSLIKQGLYVTNFEAREYHKSQNKRVSISYMVKRYADVVDSSVTVTKSDVKDFYDENPGRFVETKSRNIEYAIFRVIPSSADSAAVKKWVDNTYTQFIKTEDDSTFVNANSDKEFDFRFYSRNDEPNFDTSLFQTGELNYTVEPYIEGRKWKMLKITKIKFAPDSVQARHILIPVEKDDKEVTLERVDSIKTALASGADFAALANKYSADPGSKEKGGDLGWFKEGFMIPVINDSCFKADVNRLMEVESSFGIHLMEVTAKSPVVKKLQVAQIERSIDASRETMDGQFTASNDMSVRAVTSEDMASLAGEYQAEFNSSDVKEVDFMIPEVESSRGLIRWAFEAELGEVSEAMQFGDAFVVCRLKEIHEDGLAPLDRVYGEAEIGAIKKKKAQKFKEEMAGITDIKAGAAKLNLMVETANNIIFDGYSVPGMGREPQVMGKIFTMSSGDLSVPIEGEGGVYIISIDKIDDVNEDVNVEVEKNQLAQSRTSRVDYEVFESLKKSSDIEDRRFRFY
ncbi:MAG: SurA N-terminal domain-containing protein [Vicingaceae bacterium]